MFLLLAFCLQINYPILCYYCLIDLPLFLGWFDLILRELELIGLISSLLYNLSLYGMVIFGIYWRFRLIFFWEFSAWVFLRVLLTDRFETPCLGVRNTRSGVRARKVSRRLFDQASDVHPYSSCRSLLIFSLYEEIFSEVMKIISHI